MSAENQYPEDLIEKIIEELAPDLVPESPDFLMPEDQLSVETTARSQIISLPEYVFKSGPLFLSTCYDEFSRKYILTSVAKESSDVVDLDKSSPDSSGNIDFLYSSPQTILKSYSPNVQRWYSSCRKVPRDLRSVLNGEIQADSNILIRINLNEIKLKPCFEPVFAIACLYAFVGDELHRLCESFAFDLTPDDVKRTFGFIYENGNGLASETDGSNRPEDKVFMYLAMIPEELKSVPVYLVVQLNKVLSTDGDKAVAPYLPKATPPELKKHFISAERLGRYRQPLGIGVVKLERDKMRVGAQINVTIPVFCLRTCCNDTGIAQIIKELFPSPDAGPKSILYSDSNKFRPEDLELKLKLSFFNIGTTDQAMDRLKDLVVVSTIAPNEKRTSKLNPKFIEPQVFGDVSVARNSLNVTKGATPIKKLLPLIPVTLPGSQEAIRQLRNSFDNTIFVYINHFDKMPASSRNLCAKVEIVEIKGTIYERRMPLPCAQQVSLPFIYDSYNPYRHGFTSEAYSRVSYHVKNPSVCDEFKIKLPEVLTARHWLKFTVLHVHVKPQSNRGSLLSNIIRSSIDRDMNECDVIGVGYLPLLVNGENMVEDADHTIGLFPIESTRHPDFSLQNGSFIGVPVNGGADLPIIKIRTRALSSFASSSRQVQSFFRASPLPMGVLSSSNLSTLQQVQVFQRASKLSLQETKLIACLQELPNASTVELSRHFLVISRLLVRAMLGGSGSYDELYANPFKHLNARCHAFLTFMRVINKIFGEYDITNASETNVNKDIFEAFVEYVLDEEVPLDAATKQSTEEEIAAQQAARDMASPLSQPSEGVVLSEKHVADSAFEVQGSSPRAEVMSRASQELNSDALPGRMVSATSGVSSDPNDDNYSVSDDGGESSEPSRPLSMAIAHSQRLSSSDNIAAPELLSPDDVGLLLDESKISPLAEETTPADKGYRMDEYINTDIDIETMEVLQPLSSKSVAQSNERKSWGKYLSDSMWQSGRFLPLQLSTVDHSVLRTVGSHDVDSTPDLTDKYVDSIALHITLQIERIIAEHLTTLAVIEISATLLEDRECGGEHKDDLSVLLAGKRYRYSSRFHKNFRDLPFHVEHGWFESIDKGTIVDDDELLLDEENVRKKLEARLATSLAPTRNRLTIAPSTPFYDLLDGFKDRKDLVLRGPELSPYVSHWWPWLYEVIIYQWAASLAIILSAQGLLNSSTTESMVVAYPFEFKMDKDVRMMILERGPVLLKIILKSLTFRIKSQGMRAPILLDEQCFSALENLIMMLALEAFNIVAGLWSARDTVRLVSNFLRSLFALLAPGQVIKLIQSFFKVAKMGKGKAEELELRLLAAEELSFFDHFVAANFPLALDAPLSFFTFTLAETWSVSEIKSLNAYSASGIRYSNCPSPYALVQIFLSELVVAIRPDCPRRDSAWKILRDILTRHCFDSRYQHWEAQQRIVCMYLPLFQEILSSADYLSTLRYDAGERKEALAIFMYLLNGVPDRVLRSKVRALCAPTDHMSRTNSFYSNETVEGIKTPRVISLKATKAHGKLSDIDGFISNAEKKTNSLHGMFTIFHMILDTYEAPSPDIFNDEKAPPAAGAMASSVSSASISSIGGGSASSEKVIDAVGQMLAPGCVISNLAPNSLSDSSLATKAASATDSTVVGTSRNSTIDPMNALDQHMQARKGSNNSSVKSVASPVVGEQRRWVEKKRNLSETHQKDRLVVLAPLSKEDATSAAKQLSIASVRSILRCLWLMYDECPAALDAIVKNGEQDTFVARDANIEDSMLNGVANFKIVPFLRMAMTVLLHALYANQDSHQLVEIFLCADTAIRRFGARLFILALEDSLQYWMRATMFHAASTKPEVRQCVCNFLICFLRSSYHYFGTFSLLSNTIFAVFNEVQYDILENNRSEISHPSDVDKLLSRLGESITMIRTVAQEKIRRGENSRSRKRYPFCSSLITFMNSLETIQLASADLRRYVSHPVLYDYYGGNMLDGPFDERVMSLMQSIRNRRKAVKAEGGVEQGGATVRSGFHIEEIMMHFLQAAEVYDPMILPRFRMQWLENLARLHDLRQNRAEGAEVRWHIFKLCHQVEATWQKLWVPKPPLEWQRRGLAPLETGPDLSGNARVVSTDRNFFQVLTKALDSQMFRPWVDAAQYWTHMESALTIVTERYCSVNLLHLAERSSAHLISLYRLTKKTDQMITEYTRMTNAVKASQDRGIMTDIAMGTFYRVLYTGEGIPTHLRDKEFIFRNATHLHVSEFHALVMNHVKSIIADGVEIKMVKDATSVPESSNPNCANIVMNSVKLCMGQTSKYNPHKLLDGRRNLQRMNQMEELNQVTSFQYSVPFTQDTGKSHAKKIDDQWMRTTTLYVREPFPYILTRQLVVRRDVKVLSPIEVATQDIQDRVDSMEAEIDSGVKTTNDTNNLMRLVQGTVRPQVNAGAGEVARVFLSTNRMVSEDTQWRLKVVEAQALSDPVEKKNLLQTLSEEKRRSEELVMKLKVTLLTFLQCARQLLLKSRRILISDNAALEISPYLVDHNQPSTMAYPMLGANVQAMVINASGVGGGGRSSVPNIVSPTNALAMGGGGSGGGSNVGGAGQRKSVNDAPNVVAAAAMAATANANEANYIIWQSEMEKGYEGLVVSIVPYISDLREAASLSPKRSSPTPSQASNK